MKLGLVLHRDGLDRPLKRLVVRVTQRRLYIVMPTDGKPDVRKAVPIPPERTYRWDEAVHERLVAADGSAEAWDAEAQNLRLVSIRDFYGER